MHALGGLGVAEQQLGARAGLPAERCRWARLRLGRFARCAGLQLVLQSGGQLAAISVGLLGLTSQAIRPTEMAAGRP